MPNFQQQADFQSYSAFEQLQELLKDDIEPLNQTIINRLESSVPLITNIAKHLILAGGKRLRPLLTIASANLFDYKGASHIALAASVELIHTATLLHDDVVDESETRRGKTSANLVWNNQSTVLVGDYLYAQSFELMVEQGQLDVLQTLSWASAYITEGEVLQLTYINDVSITREKYIEIIRAKTAALFAAACKVGGQIAQCSQDEINALFEFGLNFGIAFQIIDDVLDYKGKAGSIGKDVGDDFREGKLTLPVILAYEQANAEEKTFWQKCFENLSQDEGDLEYAIELLNKHNCFEASKAASEFYADKAMHALSQLPNHPIKQALAGLITDSTNRVS